MSLLELLILAAATWRLSYLIAKEDGPYDSLKRLRALFPLGGLTSCLFCLSIWVAPGMYLLWQTDARWLVSMVAVSGGAMLLHRYTGGELV